MKHKVLEKQQNSRMCLVCGLKNPYSLKAAFYEIEGCQLVAVFRPGEEHQSYPGRLHGGITSAILDETIGRAIMMNQEQQVWGVTVELNTRFRKQIPLNEELRVVGRITKDGGRFFEGTGELLLPDGQIAASAWGKYMKLPLDKIADFDFNELDWQIVQDPADPVEITLPAPEK